VVCHHGAISWQRSRPCNQIIIRTTRIVAVPASAVPENSAFCRAVIGSSDEESSRAET